MTPTPSKLSDAQAKTILLTWPASTADLWPPPGGSGRWIRAQLYALPNAIYKKWIPEHTPTGYEYFCPHSSLASYTVQKMQVFLRRMSISSQFYLDPANFDEIRRNRGPSSHDQSAAVRYFGPKFVQVRVGQITDRARLPTVPDDSHLMRGCRSSSVQRSGL